MYKQCPTCTKHIIVPDEIDGKFKLRCFFCDSKLILSKKKLYKDHEKDSSLAKPPKYKREKIEIRIAKRKLKLSEQLLSDLGKKIEIIAAQFTLAQETYNEQESRVNKFKEELLELRIQKGNQKNEHLDERPPETIL